MGVFNWVPWFSTAQFSPPSPELDTEEDMNGSRQPLLEQNRSYGGSTPSGTSSLRLDRVLEEEPVVDVEQDLEEQGYFIGSYNRFVWLYSIVPFTSAITFTLLAVSPILFFPTHKSHFPMSELLTSAGLWSLSHLLRFPLFSLVSNIVRNGTAAVVVHTALHITLYNFLRLSILPILAIRRQMEFPLPTYTDYAFKRVWWASLGWSLIEVSVAIWQGYEQVALYKEVMIPEWRIKEMLFLGEDPEADQHEDQLEEDAVRTALDQDLGRLVAINTREELEIVYGIPVIEIPVFITTLQRIDSILLSLGLTLLISHAYLSSSLSLSPNSPLKPTITNNKPFAITFPLIILLHFVLAMLYTPVVLPRIGVHSAAYIGLMLALGAFFAGLGVWGALS